MWGGDFLVLRKILCGIDIVGYRLECGSLAIDVKLSVVLDSFFTLPKESIPTKVVGDSYVTADEANVISPESWADAILYISTKYLLGSAQYFEDSDVPSELEEIANKLLETGKNIKNLRLSCALNDCDRRDMMV